MVFAYKKWEMGLEHKTYYLFCWELNPIKFHTWSPLESYLDSAPDHYPGTSQTDPLPFDILSTHAMYERKQESWNLNGERERWWRRKTKRCESITSTRTIIGERKRNDRYDVRSSDCHAMDAHVRYGKLSNGTSGGASNLLAQEDLELIWGGSSLEYTSQVL